MVKEKNQILAFFANPHHTYERVEKDIKIFEDTFGKLDSNSFSLEFKRYYNIIKNYRRKIDEIYLLEEKKQVINTLRFIRSQLFSVSKRETIEDFQFLVKKLLYPGWTTPLKQHLDSLYIFLLNWKDFFFSYSRNKNERILQYPEAINERFRKFIRRELGLGKDMREKSDWKTENLMAKAILNVLKEANLDPFFDNYSINAGQNIESEIQKWSTNTFSLIQLINISMFHKTIDPKDNWCFLEFIHFYDANKKLISSKNLDIETLESRIFFLLLGRDFDEVFPFAGFNDEYDNWVEEIKNKKFYFIDPEASYKENRNQIKELAKTIINIKTRLIEQIK